MFKRFIATVVAGLIAAPVVAQTDAASDAAGGQQLTEAQAQVQAPEPEQAPEKILVVGQRPGPGLWKVSKGDHVLWVFGTYSPLPRKMEWRSHEVEAILANSQEFICRHRPKCHSSRSRGPCRSRLASTKTPTTPP